MIISIYVDEKTALRLKKVSRELGETVDDLASNAIAETALGYFRNRDDDPASEENKK